MRNKNWVSDKISRRFLYSEREENQMQEEWKRAMVFLRRERGSWHLWAHRCFKCVSILVHPVTKSAFHKPPIIVLTYLKQFFRASSAIPCAAQHWSSGWINWSSQGSQQASGMTSKLSFGFLTRSSHSKVAHSKETCPPVTEASEALFSPLVCTILEKAIYFLCVCHFPFLHLSHWSKRQALLFVQVKAGRKKDFRKGTKEA